MPIMKISSFNYNQINKNNNSSRQSTPIKPPLSKDTVSFKSYGYADETLKEVEEIIKSDIVPFMEDCKDLYYKVGKIGITFQKSLDSYKDNENRFINYKFKLLDDTNNPLYAKTNKFLKTAKKYEDNVLAFENLKRMSDLESYNTPQIKKELNELRTLVFESNDGLKHIKSFASAYDDSNNALQSLFDNVTLERYYPAMHKKMLYTHNKHSIALAFMMVTPYSESSKLLKEKRRIEEEIQTTPKDIFSLSKRVDKLHQNAQNTAESTKFYYENKEEMTKFAGLAKHFESLTTTPDDLKTAYLKMKRACGELAKNNRNNFERVYSNEFEPKLNQVDFNSVNELLNLQSEKIEKIQSIINTIKQEMIDKNNEEFMKKYAPED